MLVFDKIKCVYSPVCKVATNSLFRYFGDMIYDSPSTPVIDKDLRAKMYYDFNIRWEEIIDYEEAEDKYSTYYKIAFVRNPWSRLVSAFREVLRRAPFGGGGLSDDGLSYHEIYELMRGYVSFENFVDYVVNIERNHTEIINPHWEQQAEGLFTKTKLPRPIKYDFIGKLENINKDFNYVQNQLGLTQSDLCKRHVTEKYDYKLYYQNPKTIDLVGEYYKDDVELFKYEFE